MIDRAALLSDLQRLLRTLEADLLERSDSAEVPEVGEALRAEHEKAKQAERTAQNYEDWRTDYITQVAAAWVLSCVFVRFLEDNQLIDPPKIAGPGERLQRARDEHEIYFRKSPTETDREYLLAVFDTLAKLPGTRDIFGEHNPLREQPRWLSGDAAGELLRFFGKIDAETGDLIHDFADHEWDTRFLGDLYQDLSEAARKKYALLQTPVFVEEFILDRTLDPALDEFGLEPTALAAGSASPADAHKATASDRFKMIDPACGSGHFLLGAFPRILARWQKQEPGTNVRELVQRSLDSIHGVDVNPYAVAIARFRLLLTALKACGITRISDSPAFHMNLACGDSLYHGVEKQQHLGDWTDESHYFRTEDAENLRRILKEGSFHCVVANPPYITPKDRAANNAYRRLYSTCHMKYSLAVPFLERIFRLAVRGKGYRQIAGYTGQITAISFMKREFGKKLIEEFFKTVDLTHVIDTSGAYIPGHGTPTVILFGRDRQPAVKTIRAVKGIRGEPSAPEDPAKGLVWSAILKQVDDPGSESQYISVSDAPREIFNQHPWSLEGGGASELKEYLGSECEKRLDEFCDSIGITAFTLEDDIYMLPRESAARHGLNSKYIRPMLEGDAVRDWRTMESEVTVFPYEEDFEPTRDVDMSWRRYLWRAKTTIANSKMFGGKTKVESGLNWFEFGRLTSDKLRTRFSIVFAFVATHNHFVFDRGGLIFKHSAPIAKLRSVECERSHIELVGVLNSSVIGFLMRQFGHNMGDSTDDAGARTTGDPAFNTFQFNSTQVGRLPIPSHRPDSLACKIDRNASRLSTSLPTRRIGDWILEESTTGSSAKTSMCDAATHFAGILGEMILLQEDLDWQCYRLYGLIEEDVIYESEHFPIQLGQRAFEIVLARKMATGEVQTTWFERHGSTPITELPVDWPDDYKKLVERRIEVIESNPQIALIEQPEYKRRWNTESWDSQVERALRSWLLNRLESYFDFDGRMNDQGESTSRLDVALTSVARLADVARQDSEFLEVGEVYRDDAAFDVQRLVEELVGAEQVPLLPILRYKLPGLRKRAEWEKTWELQRAEDAIDARVELPKDDPDYLTEDQARDLKQQEVGDIPVPPKYKSSDLISSGGAKFWKLRGKLDVPKERWVSFPHCAGADGTLMIAWAGYDHLQLATTVGEHFQHVKDEIGGSEDPRLVPLLACLIELLPWLMQWHNEPSDKYNGLRMGDYFEGLIQDEARQMDKTVEEINAWQPPARVRGRRRQTTT